MYIYEHINSVHLSICISISSISIIRMPSIIHNIITIHTCILFSMFFFILLLHSIFIQQQLLLSFLIQIFDLFLAPYIYTRIKIDFFLNILKIIVLSTFLLNKKGKKGKIAQKKKIFRDFLNFVVTLYNHSLLYKEVKSLWTVKY